MIVAIIQARTGSTRLPRKVLAEIAGQPMLCQVVQRVRRSRYLDRVLVATTNLPEDDEVEQLCQSMATECFRGSALDVLDRYYQAATRVGASAIVRITADCPLCDPAVIDRVIAAYLGGTDCQYAANTQNSSFPDGLDVEVFSSGALAQAWKEAALPLEREHVTPRIKMNADPATQVCVDYPGKAAIGHLRWTVDEAVDLEFVRAIYDRLSVVKPDFGLEEVLEVLDKEPGLLEINQHLIRNEGLYKSLTEETPMAAEPLTIRRSLALKERASELIPSCTQTFSKGPSQFVQQVAPVFLERGAGAHVWDVDGNQFIDYVLALGPIILGYAFPAVNAAVTAQLQAGVTFSLPHRLEVEVAELLIDCIPCAEMVRFGKNGSDATAGAIRAARAYTGREVVACCGYHGWQDWYIGTTTRRRGVPEATSRLTIPFVYNEISSLERLFEAHPGQVAAVIMEPVSIEPPRQGFLEQVRETAHRNGALLIFDEVITGFRLSLGGAQEHYGVTPDLACFGKALANGFPLSAVVGPREIMMIFDEIFFSFTAAGETAALAAAKATLETLRRERVIGHLWDKGRSLRDGFNTLARELGLAGVIECRGLAPRTVITFSEAAGAPPLILKSLFQQEVLRRGVLSAGYHNICYSLSEEDVMRTLRAYRGAMAVLRQALDSGEPGRFLQGEPVQDVFRKI